MFYEFIVKNCGLFGARVREKDRRGKQAKNKQGRKRNKELDGMQQDCHSVVISLCLLVFVFVFFSGIIHKFKST